MGKVKVIDLHHEFFHDFGFEYESAFSMYTKLFPHGKQAVFVLFTEYPDGNYLEYQLGVRINRVEELIHQFLPSLSDYSERSMTLIQSPNKINKELPQRIFIQNDRQLSQTLMNAESFFVSAGFNWLDQMINPVFLERAFIHKRDNSFRSQNFIYNAFRATALAKLYNSEDYPEVRNSFLTQIEFKQSTPFTIASYLQFLAHLDSLD